MESIDIRVSQSLDDAAEVERLVERGMYRFNESQVGANGGERLVFGAHDAAGRAIGGVVGFVYWNYCSVDMLWVEGAHRRSGIGRRLMGQLEEAARARHLDGMTLDVFSFSAPAFYESLGFTTYGQLSGMPRGVTRHLMCKRFDSEMPVTT